MDSTPLEWRYLERHIELPETQDLCADINGCQGADCPFRKAFADKRRGLSEEAALDNRVVTALLGM